MSQEQELELDLRQLWHALFRRKWIIIGLFLAAAVTAYVASNLMTPVYEANTTLLVQDQRSNLQIPGLDALATGRSPVQSTLEILRSRTLAERTAERLGYDVNIYSSEFRSFRSSITVQPAAGNEVIRISVQHEDPREAQRVANTLVATYIEESLRMNSQSVRSARVFLQNQLVQFEADLELAEESLVRYKEQMHLEAPTGETEAVLQSIIRLDGQRAEAMVARETAQSRLNALDSEWASERRAAVTGSVITSNSLVSSFRSQLATLEAQLAAAREQYTDRHPRVLQLQAQITELQRELNDQIGRLQTFDTDTHLFSEMISLQADVMSQSARIEALDALIAERETLLGDLPERELHLTRLIRNASVTERIYTMLLQRFEEMRINEAMETANVAVLDAAIIPQSPVKPRKRLNVAIAGFLGLFVGVGIAFLLEYLDTTFKTPEEAEAYLGLPVLGRAPEFQDPGSGRRVAY